MFSSSFDNYRRSVGGYAPISPIERSSILNPLLQDKVIATAIGLRMLTDNNLDNDGIGYLMLANARANTGVMPTPFGGF